MGCGPGGLRIYTEDRKKVKRTATQDVELTPVYTEGVGRVAGLGRWSGAVGFRPFFVGRGKRLVVAFSDEEGGRQVVLRVKGKVLMRAKKD